MDNLLGMKKHYLLLFGMVLAFFAAVNSAFSQTNKLVEYKDWMIGPFTRPIDKPVIEPDPKSEFDCPMRGEKVKWEARHAFNPAAIVKDNKIYVLYRAEDDSMKGSNSIGKLTSRLGLAYSDDGVNFTKLPEPVFYPAVDDQRSREWYGGCEDPRLIETEDGTYVLFYTQYARNNDSGPGTCMGMATSKDLLKWKKHGPVTVIRSDDRVSLPKKSASPVCELKNGRLIAAKINGRYWMYYGEGDVYLASSADLEIWKDEGKVMPTRPGCFDSDLTEGGTPAVLTRQGIVVLYNGKNSPHDNTDPSLPKAIYCGGQALFDAADPTKLLERPERPFFMPEMKWEKTGQYKDGTTFIEGLVYFKGKWFMYYGCADTFVGVAVAEDKK
jgi:predicted GH43/DUF377 family glycosyl hydrolase